jgi:hypothetical protein
MGEPVYADNFTQDCVQQLQMVGILMKQHLITLFYVQAGFINSVKCLCNSYNNKHNNIAQICPVFCLNFES